MPMAFGASEPYQADNYAYNEHRTGHSQHGNCIAAAIHDICSGNIARQSYTENDLCKRFCEFIAHDRLRNQALP